MWRPNTIIHAMLNILHKKNSDVDKIIQESQLNARTSDEKI